MFGGMITGLLVIITFSVYRHHQALMSLRYALAVAYIPLRAQSQPQWSVITHSNYNTTVHTHT